MIIDPEDPILANFRSKYAHVHPLVLHRSVERASSTLNLFEILEGVPKEGPFSWDDSKRMWVRDEDVTARESLKSIRKRGK